MKRLKDWRSKDQIPNPLIIIGNLIIRFSMESIIFCDRKINLIVIKIESIPSIYFKDQRDQFAHSQYFLKIFGIDLLTVDLFKRSTRVIQLPSIFLKDRREGFDYCWSFLKFKEIEFPTQGYSEIDCGKKKVLWDL